MKKKSLILLLVIFLLSILTVQATRVTYTIVEGDVLPGDSAEFIVTINNNEGKTITATLKSVDLNWLLDQENKIFSIPRNSKKSVTVTYKPLGKISPGSYGAELVVETETDRLKETLPINVVAYNKVIDPYFKPSPIIDPRRGGILKLNLENKYKIKLDDLKLELEGPHFKTLKDINIEKEETKIIEIPLTLPEETAEASYNLHITLKQDEVTLIDQFLSYKVSAYEDVRVLVEPEERFLYGGQKVTKTNLGNSDVEEFYSKKFSPIAYWLASFDPEPTKVEKSKGFYNVIWEFDLRPELSKTVSYSVNYRTPTLIIVLIIIGFGAYYIFRKKNAIVVTKRVLAMHGQEGSVHVLKVLINIRNRGNFAVNNLRLLDKVPDTIKTPTQYGSLKPKKVIPKPGFTTMIWDIDIIKPGSEIVVSYVLTGKLNVLGELILPCAMIKYTFLGRRIIASSHSVSLKGRKDTL